MRCSPADADAARLLDRAEAELLCEEIVRRAPGALAPDGISEHLLADLPPLKLRGMLERLRDVGDLVEVQLSQGTGMNTACLRFQVRR